MDRPFPAYKGDQPYTFVCYAHDDSAIVYPEIGWLRDQGINIWYDEGIAPGEEWSQELADAIDAATWFLLFVTPKSVESKHCRNELGYALDRDKRLVVVHLEPTQLTGGLELSLGQTQAIFGYELNEEEYRNKLRSAFDAERTRRSLGEATGRLLAIASADHDAGFLDRIRHPLLRRLLFWVASVAVVVLLGLAVTSYTRHQAKVRWAREEALPEIERLVQENWRDFTDAYELAIEAEKYIPDDPLLARLIERSSFNIDITSEPPGAQVRFKEYDSPESDWQYLGDTPIEDVRLPIGIFRWQMTKAGYETVLAAAPTWDLTLTGKDLLIPGRVMRTLDPEGSIPQGMVRIAGAETPLGKIGDFLIDQYEVSNRQFKAFVSAGGYQSESYWEHEFVKDGEVLTWDEAMSHFVDQTGRPGPSTWIAGDYPSGKGDHPVAGISWYEAAAYARFVGRELPTAQHWGLARGEYTPLIMYPTQGGFEIFAPFSNFGDDGTIAVGSLPGITSYGAFDMAGNVREWCWNEASAGRVVRGGAWNDNTYRFTEQSQVPPFDRSPTNGVRTVMYLDAEEIPSGVFAAQRQPEYTDYYDETPVPDDVFALYKDQYSYDKGNLNSTIESRKDEAEDWVFERITVDSPYGEKRLIINLFLPRNAQPPYQTVIYMPGSGSLFYPSSAKLDEYFEFPIFLSFLLKNGRAVAYPVYAGTFERRDTPGATIVPNDSHAFADFQIKVVQDFSRSVDYLATRTDIDMDKLTYFGMSWGAIVGALILAVDDRLQTAILLGGGFKGPTVQPVVRQINFVPRITLPVLMLSGKYDSFVPYETGLKPMFDLLGTPDADKTLISYETDHIPPRNEFVKEILAWLDSQLGPAI